MLHVRYRMKTMLRQKTLLFWSLAFPIILGMLFYFMFGGINDLEQFEEVPVGVLTNSDLPEMFVSMMEEVQTENKIPLFRVKKYTDRKQAEKALQDEKIYGIVQGGEELSLIAKTSDNYSSLIKTFLDQYCENTALIEDTAGKDPDKVANLVQALAAGTQAQIKEIPLKGTDKNPYAQYFYALIAMTCLIGTMVGMHNGNDIQADLTAVGARRNVAPTPKLRQVLNDFIATYILYCIIVAIVTGVCVFVYDQDFGQNAGLVLLGGWIGSFTALAIGEVIAVFIKGSVQKKEGVCVAVFMISSFLAGLQWGDITFLIEEHCPVINRINPGTLIVNGFKSLSVYGDRRRYVINMVTLALIGIVSVIISVWKLRRVRYESI